MEPGVLPSSTPSIAVPEPVPAAQVAQTQTYGGATSNAKLLNPDISLIGDFIGTAGRNTVSPSRSLELHESEVGKTVLRTAVTMKSRIDRKSTRLKSRHRCISYDVLC